jgi:hypothetical protein
MMNDLENYLNSLDQGEFSVITDPKHWARLEVFTPYDYQRYLLKSSIAEISNRVFGFKDIVRNWKTLSISDLTERYDYYVSKLS